MACQKRRMGDTWGPPPAAWKTKVYLGSFEGFVISFKQMYSFGLSKRKWVPITFPIMRFGQDALN